MPYACSIAAILRTVDDRRDRRLPKSKGEKEGQGRNVILSFGAHPRELPALANQQHYFQAQKFAGTAHEDEVRLTPTLEMPRDSVETGSCP